MAPNRTLKYFMSPGSVQGSCPSLPIPRSSEAATTIWNLRAPMATMLDGTKGEICRDGFDAVY